MNKYLMLINIGPVQDFIATARRSRDLWFGSWFLSEISKSAANKIVELFKSENLIFPAVLDPSDLNENSAFNAANKILAVISENPQTVGNEIKKVIEERFKKIYKETFNEIGENRFDHKLAEKQLKDLIEFYWTAVEFDGSDENYSEARKKVEYLAAARKSTRQFSPVSWGASVPKSSLDGKRESVTHQFSGGMKAQELYKTLKIREKEQLCGVGLLKRNGNGKDSKGNKLDSFASTSHIAAKPFLVNLTDKEAFEKFKCSLIDLGVEKGEFHSIPDDQTHEIFGRADGHLLYEERMRDYFDDPKDISKGKQIVSDFIEKAFAGKTLSPYYALLLADGDNMGKAIDEQTTIKGHQKLSKALSEFAKAVKEIVNKKHQGSLFYAGGDDVLALVPLHTVLDCAKELNETFAEHLKEFKYTDKSTNKSKAPTLSVGIAVTHHLEPLSDALELARKAEKEAKKKDKNALAIIVDKRSGVPKMIKGSWDSEFFERIQKFAKWHKNDEFPDGAAYQLNDLSNKLKSAETETDKTILEKLQEIKIAESVRILGRKRSNQGSEKVKKDKVEELKKLITPKRCQETNEIIENAELSIEELSNELIISKIFAEALKQSEENNNE